MDPKLKTVVRGNVTEPKEQDCMHTPQVLHNAYGGGDDNIIIIAVISLLSYHQSY